MTDSDMRTLHLPIHKDLQADLEELMQIEQPRSPQPLRLEEYVVHVLCNFVFNVKLQQNLEQRQKELQSQYRDRNIRITDATVRALALEKR